MVENHALFNTCYDPAELAGISFDRSITNSIIHDHCRALRSSIYHGIIQSIIKVALLGNDIIIYCRNGMIKNPHCIKQTLTMKRGVFMWGGYEDRNNSGEVYIKISTLYMKTDESVYKNVNE